LRAAPHEAVLPGLSGAAPHCCSWRCSTTLPEMQPGPGLGRRGRCLLAPPSPLGFASVSPVFCRCLAGVSPLWRSRPLALLLALLPVSGALALLKPKPSARSAFPAKNKARNAAPLLGLSWLARDGKRASKRRESAKRSQRRRPVWLSWLWRCSGLSWLNPPRRLECFPTLWRYFGATPKLPSARRVIAHFGAPGWFGAGCFAQLLPNRAREGRPCFTRLLPLGVGSEKGKEKEPERPLGLALALLGVALAISPRHAVFPVE
jgi:hypothetical protein